MAKILLIDDEVDLRQTLRLFLEQAGHTVVEADNGDEGIALHRSESPDLVITDLIMPGKEGIETILAMRRTDVTTPIIAISGGGRLELTDFLQAARKLGAAYTLKKPFRREQLLEAVDKSLAGAEITPLHEDNEQTPA